MSAVDPRHGFLPPRYDVGRWRGRWDEVPAVPLLTDPFGEHVRQPGARIQLAFEPGALRVRAVVPETRVTVRPELPLEPSQFWRQDHLELRLEDRQIQIAPDGRSPQTRARGRVTRTGWSIEARVPVSGLRAGRVLRGLVALVRWADGYPEIAVSTPAVLGFGQVERHGEFRLVGRVGPTRFDPATFRPDPPLQRPRYTRYEVPGGAVTLRAPVAPLEVRADRHPYLWFDDAGVSAYRRKLRQPFFREARAVWRPRADDEDERALEVRWEFDEHSMNWFRVARESLVPPRTAAQRRIWELLPAEAQAAWRDVARTVTPTKEQLAVIVPALNGLLPRRDLYDAAAFAGVALPPEGQRLVRRCTARELPKRNRILIQSAIECCHKFKVDLAARIGRYLGLWLASGEDRWIRWATRTASVAAEAMIPEAQFHLHEGNTAPLVALAYDAFYPKLSAAERRVWQRLLMKFLTLYLDTARQRAWTVTTIANANAVGNAGGGFVALALWREQPRVARAALDQARTLIWNWVDWCAGADGGNTEGAQYWAYGMESFLRFVLLLEKVTGSHDGLLDQPAVRQAMNMVRVGLTNDGAMSGVNDTIPMPVGGEVAWALAGRLGDRLGLWYGDHAWRWYHRQRREPYRASALWGVLFRPELPEAREQPEPLPVALALRSVETGILRSGTNWDCDWVVGWKGSRPPFTHHNQADTGSFWLDYRGARLVMDPGYYKPRATDHSLPVIEGVAPEVPTTHTGAVVACRDGYLVGDSTAAYRGAARRVVRHLVMAGNDGVVLLDDIVARGEVLTQFQVGAPVRLRADGRGARIGPVRLTVVEPRGLRLRVLRERSLHDTHWGYHFSRCRWFPVMGSYRTSARAPLVAVFSTKPVQCRRRRGSVAIKFSSGCMVRFALRNGAWWLEAMG